MIALSLIHLFITVTESGSFARAAAKLDISLPAVSGAMARLEKALGTRLWDRSMRPGRPTEAGLRYYEQVREGMALLERAERALKESRREIQGYLHVTSNRFIAEEFLLPHLKTFSDAHPRLTLNLHLAEALPQETGKQTDILFGVTLEGMAHHAQKPVGITRHVLCASPEFLAISGTPATPASLIQFAFIGHSMRPNPGEIMLAGGQTLRLNPCLLMNDSAAIRAMALNGAGMAWLHEYVVRDALADGHLVEILPEHAREPQTLYLYYAYDVYLQPAIRAFVDFFAGRAS